MYMSFREGRFEVHDVGHQSDYLKKAGYRWDADTSTYWTGDPLRAEQLIHTAPVDVQQKIWERKYSEQASIIASRSLEPSAGFQVPVPAGLQYLAYQSAGIEYGVKRKKFLCADEQGLGKTMEFIGWVNYITVVEGVTDPQIILLCPAKLMYMWQAQLQKWLVHTLTVSVVRNKVWPEGANIRILNYENLWYFEDELRAKEWDLMGADEAHFLMNPKAERTRFVFGWIDPDGVEPEVTPIPCARAMFMTGTPIRNRPMEVFPLAHYLDPISWPSATAFAQEFCEGGKVLIKKGKHAGTYRLKAGGAANLSELQARLRGSIMLRRLKKDALKELHTKCPKTRRIINLPCANEGIASAIQEELDAWKDHEAQLKRLRLAVDAAKSAGDDNEYGEAVKQLKACRSVAFAEMSRFRKKTALLKVPFVIAHVEEILASSPKQKVVIAAHHQEVLNALQEHFAKQGIDMARVDGKTNPKKVYAEEQRFQSEASCRIFLLSIICGTGLTLTAANRMVLAELDWVPGNLLQVEDRIHRIGQYSPCLIEHLVIDKSLDSYLCPKIVFKMKMLEKALNSEDGNEREERPQMHGATASQAPSQPPNHPHPASGGYSDPTQAPKTPYTLPQGPPQGQNTPGSGSQTGPGSTPTPAAGPKPPSRDPIAAAMHRAVQTLASYCDSARSVDGKGFGKHDTDFGKAIAARPYLTDNMLPHAVRLVHKYRRQLSVDVATLASNWLMKNGGRP